jgi:hypothetical protein
LIAWSAKAERQVTALRHHYENLGRAAAARALLAALDEAERRIERDPSGGLPAPRPYPQLARYGLNLPDMACPGSRRAVTGSPNSTGHPPVIAGVFFETANIPRRL